MDGTTYQTSNVFSGLTANSYPVTVKDGNGCVSAPQIVTISQPAAFTTGAINTTGETICSGGDPAVIGSATDASGGDGAITYKWQANGSDIAGATGATYDPPSGLLTTTTYTRFAHDGTCNTSFTQSTGSWVVTVNTAPVITCPSNIVVNTDPGVCTAMVNAVATVTGSPAPTVTYSIQNHGTQIITFPHTFLAGTTIPVTATCHKYVEMRSLHL